MMSDHPGLATKSGFTAHGPPATTVDRTQWMLTPVGQAAIMPVPEFMPNWVARTIERVDELRGLVPGWDGRGSKPPSAWACAAINEVLLVLCAVDGWNVEPGVFAGADGSLQIEWDTAHRGLEIEAPADDAGPVAYLKVTKTRDPVSGQPNPSLYIYEEGQLEARDQALELLRWTLEA